MLCTIEKGDQEKQDNDDITDDYIDDYHDAVDKLSALYEGEWREKTCEQLMEKKYFKEIREFFHSSHKTLDFESVRCNYYV